MLETLLRVGSGLITTAIMLGVPRLQGDKAILDGSLPLIIFSILFGPVVAFVGIVVGIGEGIKWIQKKVK